MVRPGTRVEVRVTIVPQDVPNWSQFVARMNRVDLVRGVVDLAGPADRDTFTAPDTRVVRQWDMSNRSQRYTLTYQLGAVEEATYVRVRGTDGNRSAPGALGADIDPAGPAVDVVGDADPWVDLWMYTNPIWVLPS